ncbi:nuclear factor erythroid 2-related factor 2-like isoform X2 [Dreissena polymorpha]|uniref:BZIP domain-containing protein n=1 Tax=Dreissena polymorpha TaxID=45954 RepID=A0A9D3YMB2_DREPO|nr:nuclear factor erythroid 2-related factor 2-like isoform X2 [Dreissena polymorpha]KAH3701483.1 hypothetical protein DPMN_076472 [Dreissena polymorpha]
MMELEHNISQHNNHVVPQDLDLIEVLWRQDIDLGIGKDVFDPNLRLELERERELELQKERQKQKEHELLQKKLEEQHRNEQQRWLHDNFTQDGETGEWVPLGGSRVPPPPPGIDLNNLQQEQFVSTFDAIPSMMGDGMLQEANNYDTMPPPPQYPSQQGVANNHSQQSMYNSSYNGGRGLNNMNLSVGCRPQMAAQHPCTLGHQLYPSHHQQNQYSGNHSYNHHPQNYTHQQNITHHQQQQVHNQTRHHHQQQQQQQSDQMGGQMSLEATWQDLVNILELPQANRTPGEEALLNMSLPSHGMGAHMPNASAVLIQNASMPTPAPMSGNISFNNTGMVSQCHGSPSHSSSLLSPCSVREGFNSSMPSGGPFSGLNMDQQGDGFFPNITSVLSTEDPTLDNINDFLPDLEDDLEDINFSEMGIDDADLVHKPSTSSKKEDSSDSAVSMGSAESPDQNDFSDSDMSPFDGIEGATGGQDGSTFPKTSKYDPDDFRYSNSCSYSSGGDSNCSSNFSSGSNDTGSGSHFGSSGSFSPNSNGHINHNHTYPLKPGQDPKDYTKKNLMREGRHKGPQSKDHKRVAELKIPFTVDQIVNSPVEEFNEMMTKHKFSDQQLQLIRDIRRRGKNKVAAQNCRKRKINVLEHLEDEMGTLEKTRDKLLRERHLMDKQTLEMKEKLGLMYSEIFHSLRDEHGHPYDPARFSLQQSSDGDVFLVPRNYTFEDESMKKKKSEQK